MDMDWNLKSWAKLLKFSCHSCKNPQQILWLVFPDEISFWHLHDSKGAFCVWVMMGKGTGYWLQHRIDLTQQHPCDRAPLNSLLIYSRTSISRIPYQLKPNFLSLDHISLKFTPITRTVFRFLSEFGLPGFYCKIIRSCP